MCYQSQVSCSATLCRRCNTLDKEIGLATVKSGVEKIREVVEGFGGELAIKMEPSVVSESDDVALTDLMQRMEAENAEVSGDEPESDLDDEDVEEIEEAKANGVE